MVQQVNSLIYNALCSGESVWLPQVGTLIVRQESAERKSSKRLVAPCRVVTFTSEKRGESLEQLIAHAGNVDEARATAIYEQWLQQSYKDGVLVIEGVGRVVNRVFEIEETLLATLNPESPKRVVTLRPRRSWGVYLFCALCVVAALGMAGYVLYSEYIFAERMGKAKLRSDEVAVAVTPPDNMSIISEVPRSEDAASADNVVTAEAVEVVEAANPTAEPVVEVASEAEPMSVGCSYAVYGVYSELANAKRYQQIVNKRFADLNCRIFEYKGRYMVAIYETSTRNECITLVDMLKSSDKAFREVWIYTNR